jgi:hypothetical protein
MNLAAKRAQMTQKATDPEIHGEKELTQKAACPFRSFCVICAFCG